MDRWYPRSDVAPQSVADLLDDRPVLKKRDKKKAKARRAARRRNRG